MDMERSLILTTDNGAAQSAGASLIWLLQHPSAPLDLQDDDEAAGFFGRASDDGQDEDDSGVAVAYQFEPEFGFLTEEIVQGYNYLDAVVTRNLVPQQHEVDFENVVDLVFGGGAYSGGAAVPASDAAVANLEKQAFHATAEGRDSECGVTGCAICLEDFEDGEEVTVMPCSRGHEFHTVCITDWLGQSNTCPLCRHALPTDVVDDDGL